MLISELSKENDLTLSYQCIKDGKFMRSIYENFKPNKDIQFLDECLTVDRAYELYKMQDMIISNRLHCVLFAYITGSRGVAFTDKSIHTKLTSSLETYETNPYSIDINAHPENNKSEIIEWLNDVKLSNFFHSIAESSQNKTKEILRNHLNAYVDENK